MTDPIVKKAAIEVKGVVKTFKSKKAVDGVDFTIQAGTVTALLGPNGAGKTTMLSMMLGLLEPSEGSVTLLGGRPTERRTRERIGAMLQEVGVMDGLKAIELIDLFRSYYGRPAPREYLIGLTGFGQTELNRGAQKLSGGQKRSLGFALAMAGDPDVLFFDEPTVGLDTTARRRFWAEIRELARHGRTIVFSTHYLEEADREADRVLLFHQGKLVADGPPEEIKRTLVRRSLSFVRTGEDANGPRNLRLLLGEQLGGGVEADERNGRTVVTVEDTDAALRILIGAGIGMRDIRVEAGRLDTAFEQLTGWHEEADNETHENETL